MKRHSDIRIAYLILTEGIEKRPLLVLSLLLVITSLLSHWHFITGNEYLLFLDIGIDTLQSILPYYYMVIQKLASGDFTFWEFSLGLGANTMSIHGAYFDPFFVPVIIFGVIFGVQVIHYFLIIMYLLRIFSAAYICYYFLSEFKFSNGSKIIAAYLYGFNGFMMLWGHFQSFGTAGVLLILMLLLIEKSMKDSRFLPYLSIATAVMLLFSFYFGYMILLFSGLYTLYRVVQNTKMRVLRHGARTLLSIGFSVVAGGFVSMIVSLPAILFALRESIRIPQDGVALRIIGSLATPFSSDTYQTIFFRLFSNNFQGVGSFYHGVINYYEAPQFFYSSFLLGFCMIYLSYILCTKHGFKSRLLVSIAVLFVVWYITMPTLHLVFAGFVRVDFRSTFILMPIFAFVVAKSCDLIAQKAEYRFVSFSLYFGVIISFLVSIYVGINAMLHYHRVIQSIGIFSMVVGYILLIYRNATSRAKSNRLLVILAIFVVINVSAESYLSSNFRSLASSNFPYMTRTYSITNETRILANQLQENGSFHRISKTYYYLAPFSEVGEPLTLRYNSLSHYLPLPNRYLVSFFREIWPEQFRTPTIAMGTNAYRHPVLCALVNIRYVLSRGGDELIYMPEYQLINRVGDIDIYRNTLAGGFGIFFDSAVSEQSFLQLDQAERIALLKHHVVLYDPAGELTGTFPSNITRDDWEGFGEQSVDFSIVGNSSRLSGQFEALRDGFLFLPIPHSNGWRAYVNGERIEHYRANIGFIAVPIRQGFNLIDMSFRTPGLGTGMIFTGIGILMFVGLIIVTGKRKRKH